MDMVPGCQPEWTSSQPSILCLVVKKYVFLISQLPVKNLRGEHQHHLQGNHKVANIHLSFI